MFKALASKFNDIFSSLSSKAITEEDLEKAIKEIKIALLEADVALETVKAFTSSLREKLKGEEVIKKTNPVQTIIKLTQDEITNILSLNHEGLKQNVKPLIIMMVGLQGAGKTTATGRLALKLTKQGKKVLLASLDVRRPAAQLQLEVLSARASASSLPIIKEEGVMQIAKRAMKEAQNYDVLIFDTAGRNELEEDLMKELEEVKKIINPAEILLTMDALYGRQSLNLAKAFNERLSLTGVILTRMESDTRGGIAFNIKHSLQKPIKFYGTGEALEDFEDFYPERIANRVLDMGDVVSLVEKAKDIIDEKEAEKMRKKMEKGSFDFEDFLSQIKGLRKMGGLSKIASFIPGASKFADMLGGDKQDIIYKQEAIILSMTPKERKNPNLIMNSNSRKVRIANGSGVKLIEVNKLLKQFEGMRQMMEKFGKIDKSALANTQNIEDLMKNFTSHNK
jgi:signal recognition particle subunit SRP54